MELYVNHMFLGANAYGMEAGAETYFGKQAKDLTLGEAALLAVFRKLRVSTHLLRIQRKRKERRDLVLDLMAKNGFVSQSEADAAKQNQFNLPIRPTINLNRSRPL
jgi:membrane carboxypeptidase/penicillin-binding protein